MKVYLDNCAFNRPFDDQRQIRIFLETQAKLYIQKLITGKRLDLVCSYMSLYENSENPNRENRNSIQSFLYNAAAYISTEKSSAIVENMEGHDA